MHHLEVIDLRASYGRHQVLDGVSFPLAKGEVVALVGRWAFRVKAKVF